MSLSLSRSLSGSRCLRTYLGISKVRLQAFGRLGVGRWALVLFSFFSYIPLPCNGYQRLTTGSAGSRYKVHGTEGTSLRGIAAYSMIGMFMILPLAIGGSESEGNVVLTANAENPENPVMIALAHTIIHDSKYRERIPAQYSLGILPGKVRGSRLKGTLGFKRALHQAIDAFFR